MSNEEAKMWFLGLVVAVAVITGIGSGLVTMYEIPKLKAEITALQFDFYKGAGNGR